MSMPSCRRPGVCASYVKVPAGAVFAHGAASCVFPPCSGNLVCSAGVALNPDAQTRSHRPGDSIMRVTASRLRRRSMSKLASGMVRMTRNYSGTLLPDIQRCFHVVSQRLIHVQAPVRQSNRNRTSSSIASQAASRTRHRIRIHTTTTTMRTPTRVHPRRSTCLRHRNGPCTHPHLVITSTARDRAASTARDRAASPCSRRL